MTTTIGRRSLLAAVPALSILGLAACGEVTVEGTAASDATVTVTDDQDREITLTGPIERAVVLNSYKAPVAVGAGAGAGRR